MILTYREHKIECEEGCLNTYARTVTFTSNTTTDKQVEKSEWSFTGVVGCGEKTEVTE